MKSATEKTPDIFFLTSESIKETFSAIDRFEWQACDDLRKMRDEKLFEDGGYTSFEKYCEGELAQWGGYRRVNQILAAKQVIDSLEGTEFDGVVKRESHARPLLCLVKTPEKLKQAVAIAVKNNPQPIADDFKKAVLTIVPPKEQKPKSHATCSTWGDPKTAVAQEQLFLRNPQNSDSCVVIAENTPSVKTYTEEQLQQAIEEAKQGLYSELQASAQTQISQEVLAYQRVIQQRDERITQLQQQVEQLRSLQQLKQENQHLRDRIAELENAVKNIPAQQWGNTATKQAEKLLNAETQKVIKELPPELHLKVLATTAPQDNASVCLELMGMALSNLAIAMNNSQLAQAAALLEQVIEPKSEHEQMIAEAVEEIRKAIASGCDWEQLKAVTDEFEQIKNDTWNALSTPEREAIKKLKANADFSEQWGISKGDWVTGSDIYHEMSTYQGIVENIKSSTEQVFVVWKSGNFRKERNDYHPSELKVISNPVQEVA